MMTRCGLGNAWFALLGEGKVSYGFSRQHHRLSMRLVPARSQWLRAGMTTNGYEMSRRALEPSFIHNGVRELHATEWVFQRRTGRRQHFRPIAGYMHVVLEPHA